MTDSKIVTLQFGEYANYVGTHFWNAQVWFHCELIYMYLVKGLNLCL